MTDTKAARPKPEKFLSNDQKTALALARCMKLAAAKPKRNARKKPESLSEEGFAYFIGPAGGPIKIGFSMDPYERRYRLQTGYPELLHLWAEAPGGRRAEDRYQARFAKHWIGGEWFARCPEIEAEIARLKAEAEV